MMLRFVFFAFLNFSKNEACIYSLLQHQSQKHYYGHAFEPSCSNDEDKDYYHLPSNEKYSLYDVLLNCH